jgi:hypothetical protein
LRPPLLLLAALLLAVTIPFAAPVNLPQPHGTRANDSKGQPKQGTCDTGYEWSVIGLPSEEQGGTCCPTGYKAESSIVPGLELGMVFCCPGPNDASQVSCDATLEQLPLQPLSCPKPSLLVQVICQPPELQK